MEKAEKKSHLPVIKVFVSLPFGMSESSFVFQSLINTVLRGLHDFTAGYIDDILIFSINMNEHLIHI